MSNRLPELVAFKHIDAKITNWQDRFELWRHINKIDHSKSGNACWEKRTPMIIIEKTENNGKGYHSFYYEAKCTVCGNTVRLNDGHIGFYRRVGDTIVRAKSHWDDDTDLLGNLLVITIIVAAIAAIIYLPVSATHDFNNRLRAADKQHTYSVGEKAICNTYAHPGGDDNDDSSRTKMACTVIRHTKTGYYMTKHADPNDESKAVQTEERTLDMQQIK